MHYMDEWEYILSLEAAEIFREQMKETERIGRECDGSRPTDEEIEEQDRERRLTEMELEE